LSHEDLGFLFDFPVNWIYGVCGAKHLGFSRVRLSPEVTSLDSRSAIFFYLPEFFGSPWGIFVLRRRC
jgi:hypothetical protein